MRTDTLTLARSLLSANLAETFSWQPITPQLTAFILDIWAAIYVVSLRSIFRTSPSVVRRENGRLVRSFECIENGAKRVIGRGRCTRTYTRFFFNKKFQAIASAARKYRQDGKKKGKVCDLCDEWIPINSVSLSEQCSHVDFVGEADASLGSSKSNPP